MKVHEILSESTVNEVLGTLFKQGIKGISTAGVKMATNKLAGKYSKEITDAYTLGTQTKPLTAAYAEKFFVSLGYPKLIAKELSKNKSIIDTAAKQADKSSKMAFKELGKIVLSARAEKAFGWYKKVFAGVQAWQLMIIPTQQFLANLDEQYELYQNGTIDLTTYQSYRQALATAYVGQLAAGITSWAAIRGASSIVKGMVNVLPNALANPIKVVLRGATDAALLHFEINYLNTAEGKTAIGNFMVAGSVFEFPVGESLQQSVGAAAVNAGAWLRDKIVKSIEAVNKLPGVNIKTAPGVPTPNALPSGTGTPTARPFVTPRTSAETWGKTVPPQQ